MPSDLVIELTKRPNIFRPRWDQSTFDGRARHFFTITNPLNLFATSAQLEDAKRIVDDYRLVIVFNYRILN
jgi:hypothetical protein